VVTETALAVVLAIGASLLIRTFFYLRDVAPGFRVDRLLTARITPPPKKFTSREQALAYWTEALDRVRRIPGVQAATYAIGLPMTGENFMMSWPVEGHQYARPQDYPVMANRVVEPDYFKTLQIPLRRGRLFSEQDTLASPRVVLVNEAFVRRFWSGQDPIGKHVGGREAPLCEVVGVVADVRQEESTKDAVAEVYFSARQGPAGRAVLAVRADPRVYSNLMLLEPALRRAVAELDPTLPVTQVAEMQRLVTDRIAPKRLSAQLIAVFAGLALLLAAVGIYGVLSFSVAQRTHEIGVRLALGAEPARVLGMVVAQAAGLAAAGIVIGCGCALWFTRVLRNLLFGVSANDPWAYATSAAALLAISVIAAVIPAWRAARVDPLVALRHE
jgi:putative ABC transport system permease protein